MKRFHKLLLLAVLPLTGVWIPVFTELRYGTITVLDLVFVSLWITTLACYHRQRRVSDARHRVALRIAVAAALPALFGVAASLSFDAASPVMSDLFRHLKRFGMAGILPLAVLVCRDPRMPRRLVLAVLMALLIITVVPFTPLFDLLPINARTDAYALGRRFAGSIGNPNDIAYVGLLSAILALAFRLQPGHRKYVISTAVLVLLGVGAILGSASRSGMAALLGAVLFVLLRNRLSFARIGVAAGLAAAVAVAWMTVPEFQSRMATLLEGGLGEQNVIGRLEAQQVTIRTWVRHPLGVGFVNFPAATREFAGSSGVVDAVYGSDSVYCDFLLGTGVFGLAAMIATLVYSWRLLQAGGSGASCLTFQSGIVATVLMGVAAVAPASAFVSPFLFVLVGLGGSRVSRAPRPLEYGIRYFYENPVGHFGSHPTYRRPEHAF